jgi:uncharacterized protein (TIGR03083 family)
MTQVLDMPARADISQPAGKDTLLRVLEGEYRSAVAMMLEAEDGWETQTPCADWQVRDLTGHLLDVAFSYLGYFKMAERGWPAEAPRGMIVYAGELSAAALVHRELPRLEMVARLESLSEHLFATFRALDDAGWTSLVPHKYVGPVPAFMMATFQLMDYTVHNWDYQKALGRPAELTPEAADVLVPYMFGLKGICFDGQGTCFDGRANKDVDLKVQVDIAGRADDQWTVTVKDGAYGFAPGAAEDAQAVFTFDSPAEFALDAYQRLQGGTAAGDDDAIKTFRSLFFTI